jgi:hypothetical protein
MVIAGFTVIDDAVVLDVVQALALLVGVTHELREWPCQAKITPPSAGSKRPSIDGGDDSASQRVKGSLYAYPLYKTALNSNILDTWFFGAADEPGVYPEDGEALITRISFTTPNPAPGKASPTKTSSAEASFGASTIFARAGEQPGSSHSTTVATAATIKGSTTESHKGFTANNPSSPALRQCGRRRKAPSPCREHEYQTRLLPSITVILANRPYRRPST